jgi:hypothetical protein
MSDVVNKRSEGALQPSPFGTSGFGKGIEMFL